MINNDISSFFWEVLGFNRGKTANVLTNGMLHTAWKVTG